MRTFLKTLQSRNIDGVAVTYAVAGWLLVQVASIVFPTFAAPVWVLRIFIVTVVAGFPAALTLAWFTAPEAARAEATTDGMSQREVVLLALLGVVLLLSLGELGYVVGRRPVNPEESRNAPVEASIAVLPFQNLSSDRNTGYFAAGVQDEILTRLTKIGTLKVISRRSTDHFASQPDDLREIGQRLGVANVVEGSVQRIGDAVHINVQLVDAATDAHVWAEVYDRRLEDVFAIEGEVATAIAEALNAKIGGTEKRAVTMQATASPAAHDAYLRGLAYYRKTDYSSVDVRNAQLLLEQAVRLDPAYATAWALLAHVEALEFFNDVEPKDIHRAAARAALDTALRLQPDLAEVQQEQGYYEYWVERDYEGARRRFEDLQAKWPNNAEILEALALIARRQGRWEESTAYADRAIELDPMATRIRLVAIGTLTVARDYSRALRHIEDALNIWPDNQDFVAGKVSWYLSQGQLGQADAVLAGLHPESSQQSLYLFRVTMFQAVFRRDYDRAIHLLDDRLAQSQSNATDAPTLAEWSADLGDQRRFSGDSADARRNYIQARDELISAVKNDPGDGDSLSELGLIYCRLGDRKAAVEYGDRAMTLFPAAKDAWVNIDVRETRAMIDVCLDDRDRAIPELARLLKLPGYLTSAQLRLYPDFDRLRGDPRFQALTDAGKSGTDHG